MESFKIIIQIVLWISVPILLLAGLVTIFFHYRKKKKVSDTESDLYNPQLSVYTSTAVNNAENSFTDYTNQKTDEMGNNKLQMEYTLLKEKYTALLNEKNSRTEMPDTDNEKLRFRVSEANRQLDELREDLKMYGVKENHRTAEITSLKKEIVLLQSQQHNNSSSATDEEKYKLLLASSEEKILRLQAETNDALRVKEEKFVKLEKEKSGLEHKLLSLQQQNDNVAGHSNPDEVITLRKKNEIFQDEIKRLEEKNLEYAYLDDLMNEKKQQVAFLENQVTQRVRQVHEAEKSNQAAQKQVSEYSEKAATAEKEVENLNISITNTQEIINKQKENLHKLEGEKESQISVIKERQDYISLLEKSLEGQKNKVALMTKEAEDQSKKIQNIENKLKVSSRLLARIYSDLGKSFASIFSSTDDTIELSPGEFIKIEHLSSAHENGENKNGSETKDKQLKEYEYDNV